MGAIYEADTGTQRDAQVIPRSSLRAKRITGVQLSGNISDFFSRQLYASDVAPYVSLGFIYRPLYVIAIYFYAGKM